MRRAFEQIDFPPIPVTWKVDVTAVCPKCGSEMNFGSTEARAVVLKCRGCGYGGVFPELRAGELADAVLARVTGGIRDNEDGDLFEASPTISEDNPNYPPPVSVSVSGGVRMVELSQERKVDGRSVILFDWKQWDEIVANVNEIRARETS